MKGFIFNSGAGTRMGALTKQMPKCLLTLANGESILGRQIRFLAETGLDTIIITTGPFEEQIISLTKHFPKLSFIFVNNNMYRRTNNIYSLYLAQKYIDDDVIVLHGDLVFDALIINELRRDGNKDVCLINKTVAQPKKDFKGKIENGLLREISVDIGGADSYALQPLYKFSLDTMKKWIHEVNAFVAAGKTNVYAENALNNILPDLNVSYLDYGDFYVKEIDDEDDLSTVNNEFLQYDYKNQTVITSCDYLEEIYKFLIKHKLRKPLFVHGKHLLNDERFAMFVHKTGGVTFTGYAPNPTYEDALKGLAVFKANTCDVIVAIGGGSCIDVAKAVKAYSPFEKDFINENLRYVGVPLIAVPTTAGTGSESTRFAVIYYDGEKQSLVHDSLLPNLAILNCRFLYTLPEYHKKSALLDVFSQAVESFWSVHANAASKCYAKAALRLFLDNYQSYLNNELEVYNNILQAANIAGKAINITQTTAPHAMSYKVTTVKNIAHGHAVSIMLPPVISFMIKKGRGDKNIAPIFSGLMSVFKVRNRRELLYKIKSIIDSFRLPRPTVNRQDIGLFLSSINKERLNNHPLAISEEEAAEIFYDAFNIRC